MLGLRNQDVTLRDICLDVEQGAFGIPVFQRGFVWKVADIEKLGDSIIRGYPVSSLLLLDKKNEALQDYPAVPLKTDGTMMSEHNLKYVLDGQQRLTSISKILMGYDDQNQYYFDLLAILNDAFPERNVLEYNNFKDRLPGGLISNQPKVGDSFCHRFKRTKNESSSESRHLNRYILCSTAFTGQYSSLIAGFVKNLLINNENDKSYLQDYADFTNKLNAVMGDVINYKIPVTSISSKAPAEKVIDIFERLNQTGVKLNAFSLVNGKTYNFDGNQGSLETFLSKELMDWIKFNPGSEKAIKSMFGYDPKNSTGFNKLDKVIRILLSYEFIAKGIYPQVTKANMLKKRASFWFEEWTKHKDTLLNYIAWTASCNLDKPATFIEYMAAVFMKYPEMLNEEHFKNNFKRVARYFVVTSETFVNGHVSIVLDFCKFAEELKNKHKFNKYETKGVVTKGDISLNNLYRIKSRAAINTIFSIMHGDNHQGRFIFDLMGQKVGDAGSSFDTHHLIPKALYKSLDEAYKYESIGNMVMLNSRTNRHEINDLDMKTYLNKIRSIHGEGKFNQILDWNLIPSEWECMNESQFINKRMEMIVDYLNSYFSES